jgi:hypothetical protein
VLDAFNAFCAPFVEDVRAVFMQKTAGVVRTLGESASHRRYAGPLVGLVVKPLTMTREQVADVAPETSARALACDFESFVDDVTRLGKDVRIGNLDVRHDVAMGDTGSPMLRLIWVMRGDVK